MGHWQTQGACRGTGANLWHSDPDTPNAAQKRHTTTAKLVCATCPVQTRCRQYALDNNENHGVWGGMTARERYHFKEAQRQARIKPTP